MSPFFERLNELGRWLAGHLGQMSEELLVLAAVVYGLIYVLRIKSAAVRHLFWALVLIKPVASFLVASPISLYALLPERPAPVVAQAAPPPTPMVEPVSVLPPRGESLAPSPEPAGAGPTTIAPVAPSAWRTLDRHGALVLGWLAVSSALLLRLLVGLGYVARLRRTADLQTKGVLADTVAEAVRALRPRQRVRIAFSDRVSGPVLTGVVQPIILIPRALAEGLTADRLRMLVAHEVAHARRWDNAWLLLQRLAESLLFFHPVVWICTRMMRREAEYACDAAVLTAYGKSAEYADGLTRLAEMRLGLGSRLLANTVAAAESNLAGRVRRILDGRTGRMTASFGVLSAVMLIVVGCLGLPSGWRERSATSAARAKIDEAAWTTLFNTDFGDPTATFKVANSDPGLAWSVYEGAGRFSGTPTHSEWSPEAVSSLISRDGRTLIEVSCDFRIAKCDGYHNVNLLAQGSGAGVLLCFEGERGRGRYRIPTQWLGRPSQFIEGAFAARGFGDETSVFHKMRMIYDRAASNIYYYVDRRHLGTVRVDGELGPLEVALFRSETPRNGSDVDIRCNNLRVREAGPVRNAAADYDPSADRVMSDAEAAEARSEAGERLYSAMTTQGETVVELYYGADSQRPFTGISVKKYVNGVIERKCEFKDGLQNGLRQEWYATGIQRAATSYENSLRHGPEKRWYPNGQLGFEGGYWRGRRDGQITEWHENGQLRLKAFYRGARQDELRQAWHDNPAQEVLAQYLLTGIPEGVFTWWYPNGQKEIEGEISPDGKLLKLDRWRPNGKEERVDPELLETRTTEETRKTRWFLHGNPALPLTPDAEPSEMGKGIGRGLLDRAVAMCRRAKPDVMELEVHSSPWAVPVYGRLGFSATGPEQQACGMRFTRMVKRLEPQSGQLRRAEGARG